MTAPASITTPLPLAIPRSLASVTLMRVTLGATSANTFSADRAEGWPGSDGATITCAVGPTGNGGGVGSANGGADDEVAIVADADDAGSTGTEAGGAGESAAADWAGIA